MKVLFVHQKLATFVEKDLEILRETHDVRECLFAGWQRTTPARLFSDILTLWRGVWWCDMTFSWFGKLHAFFSVLFSKVLGKKAIVVAGGDEVVKHNFAGKAYGLCAYPLKKWFAYFTFTCADLIIAVSRASLKDAIYNAKTDPRKTQLIYHGFDCHTFRKLPNMQKEDMVITVGYVCHENCYIKGLELFVKTARLLPDISFYMVGSFLDDSIDHLRTIAPSNVVFTGGLDGQAMVEALSKAKVYVQASEYESFGCSVAEAMLCECVPVVSRRGALLEVVGECGFYAGELTSQTLAEQIEKALRNPQVGPLARERIMKNFPLEKRKAELIQAVKRAARGGSGGEGESLRANE